MPKASDCRIALVALIAFAAWLFIGLPLLYLPGESHVHGEILGVKYGEWLLFLATVGLWWATWRLVIGADRTAERQLRAYVSVEPTIVYNFGTAALIMIGVDVQNHGETPAGIIFHDFETALLPNPLPGNFVFPVPSRRLDTNNSLFPKSKVPVRFNHDNLLTPAEVADIGSDVRRFHICFVWWP
jgi:hypothetical protein